VHDILPRSTATSIRAARMNVIDEEGRIVFGPPIKVGEFTVGRPFPTTLYNWQLQVALTTAEELNAEGRKAALHRARDGLLAGAVALAGSRSSSQASLKERRLAALKSDFVANVSHELKTPLALIRMFGEMLLLDRVPTTRSAAVPADHRERERAPHGAHRERARLRQGRARQDRLFDFAPGDVGEAVGAPSRSSRHRGEREAMTISLVVAPDLPAAMIDARALELASINLIDNALQVRQGRREASRSPSSRRGAASSWCVSDFGPGIDGDDSERIFERFVPRQARQHAACAAAASASRS
jgi:two-component system phosphate regulon sensor histidine kinase PhoR